MYILEVRAFNDICEDSTVRAVRNFERAKTDTSSPNFGEEGGSEVNPFCPGWHMGAWVVYRGRRATCKDLAQNNYSEERIYKVKGFENMFTLKFCPGLAANRNGV